MHSTFTQCYVYIRPIVSLHEVFLYDTPLKLTLDHAQWVFLVITVQHTFCHVFFLFDSSEILEYKGSHVLTITPAYHIERSVLELNRSLSNERVWYSSTIEPKNEKSQTISRPTKSNALFSLERFQSGSTDSRLNSMEIYFDFVWCDY